MQFHRRPDEHGQVFVLLGGGIDSTLLVAAFLELGYEVEAIFFDYGQPALVEEREAAHRIACHFEIRLKIYNLPPIDARDGEEFPDRNQVLIDEGLKLVSPPSILAIGIHAGTPFVDCSPPFFAAMEDRVRQATGGGVTLAAPLLEMSKADIVQWAQQLDVPFSYTYSCHWPAGPCGTCLTCLDLAVVKC